VLDNDLTILPGLNTKIDPAVDDFCANKSSLRPA
jgi:hypothetical protein